MSVTCTDFDSEHESISVVRIGGQTLHNQSEERQEYHSGPWPGLPPNLAP